jgi:hypothetical protein
LTASEKKPLVSMVAQATAIPRIDRNVRTGFRSTFRRMIREGWESHRPMPIRSR